MYAEDKATNIITMDAHATPKANFFGCIFDLLNVSFFAAKSISYIIILSINKKIKTKGK